MEEEILDLEKKANNLSCNLLSSSIINDDITKIKKDYYKSLIIALNIIRKQKQELINLQILLLEVEDECNKKDIMRFCS
jgi:hypothetical protein